jgi:hypothetical protein
MPPLPSTSPSFAHGHHRNASPPSNNIPLPLSRTWLLSEKPSDVQASMEVAGAMVFRSTSSSEKSVCVSSFDLGPRSRVLGGCERMWVGGVVCRHRREADIVAVMGAIERFDLGLRHCESMRMHWDVFRDILVVCNVVWMYVEYVVAMQNDDARHGGSLGPVFSGSALEPPPFSATAFLKALATF